MVRFARADGSKGSNKRQLEEPTPWVKMAAQLESNKKKKRKDGAENGGNDGTPELTMKKVVKNTDTKKQTTQNPVKKNKKVKKGTKTSEPQYSITPEAKRIQVFQDGTKRTRLDLPYKESDLMTKYGGIWVKKEMVEELDRLKTALQEEGLDKKEMRRRMMKAKRKAQWQLEAELIYQQKNLISEATGGKGKVDTVSKKVKGTKKNIGAISPKKKNQKPLVMDNGSGSSQEKTSSVEKMDDDTDSQGKDDVKVVVTTPATGKVKKNKKTNNTGNKGKTNKKTNKGKLKNGVQPLAGSEVNKKNEVKENKLTTEMAPSLVAGDDNSREDEAESSKLVIRKTEEEIQTRDSNSQLKFEENELMTNYDGYWVLREDVESLEAAKKTELEAIYAARTNDMANSQAELTKEEQLALRRAMKKLKRLHNRKLLQRLSKMWKKSDLGVKRKDKKKGDADVSVKFDGFWVKKEAADRLHNLREKLFKEGLSKEEVDKLILKERRKEERLLKNERKSVCLNCREPDHVVSACPNLVQAEGEGQTSICYACGSTEHIYSACNLRKATGNKFSFAICFICKESGHISRLCPDNPQGVYPMGGACRGCGSVLHLAKNCPDLQKGKEECNVRVGRLKGEELEALDENEEAGSDQDQVPSPSKSGKPKVVKF